MLRRVGFFGKGMNKAAELVAQQCADLVGDRVFDVKSMIKNQSLLFFESCYGHQGIRSTLNNSGKKPRCSL